MDIAIGADHAGFEQKQLLIDHLRAGGHAVTDFGPDSLDSVDYPDYAARVGFAVADGEHEVGILVCGTGIGMSIAANKIDGVRAANVVLPGFARLAREHNDANVLTLSARRVAPDVNAEIADEFLSAAFAGSRHARRVDKITALESADHAD